MEITYIFLAAVADSRMRLKTRKYIVVLGSLMSGLGKGILTASIAKLLQSKGLRISPIKFDGYLNVDCGTMNPYQQERYALFLYGRWLGKAHLSQCLHYGRAYAQFRKSHSTHFPWQYTSQPERTATLKLCVPRVVAQN